MEMNNKTFLSWAHSLAEKVGVTSENFLETE